MSTNYNNMRGSLITLFTFIVSIASAQHVTISVVDNQNNPLIGTTVSLKHLTDGSQKFGTTNSLGVLEIENLSLGTYMVKISYIGFESIEQEVDIKKTKTMLSFTMSESSYSLDEVTVSAERPLIRYEYDKMIIDPEPISDISTNTLEVLESTPGLFVDHDGGVYLSGTSPATIYINGREQRMSNDDISTLLRSLPPGSVERIEIMRTPSTKYSAASTGGIVNIILKKGFKIGRFGSVRAGFNQGVKGNRFVGLNINDSGDKSTLYLNLNYNLNNRLENLNINRDLNPETFLFQEAENLRQSHQIYCGYGLNFEASESINLSYDGRINVSLRDTESFNNNFIKQIESNNLISQIDNSIDYKSNFIGITQDFGAVIKIDTLGSEWDNKLSYHYNYNQIGEMHNTRFLKPENESLMGEGESFQKRHFIEFQSDLTFILPYKVKMETGVRSTFQNYLSDSDYKINLNDLSVNDPQRTNAYNFQENINATYAQFSKDLGSKFSIIAGARLEHTFMQGNQTIPVDTNFVVNRVDFFPYAYFSYKIIEMFGFDVRSFLIYRKTITRPGYQNLNPYVRFVDQFLYDTGNPALNPQFTENVELNISIDDMPILAIGRRYTTDIFANVIYQDEEYQNVAVRTYDNLGQSTETYFRAIAGIPPGGTYFFAIGTQYNYNKYDGFYENQAFCFERGSWRFFTFHALRLFSNTRITMSGFLMENGLFNFYELETFGQLNFGIRQNLLDDRLTISISARDVLKTMVNEFTYNQGTIHAHGNRYTDNRRFGINIRYNFGIGKKEQERNFMQFDMED